MEVDEFIIFCKSIHKSDTTGGAGKAATFFNSVYIGYEYPNFRYPEDDKNAKAGYELGLRLREQHHEKFK
jgi:hypothetical protein